MDRNQFHQAVIVVGKDAPLPEQFAAQELCRYIQRISGAELPIRTDMEKTEGPRILIGNPDTNRSTAQAFESAHIHFGALDLGEEGFVVRTIGKDLILAGACGRATLYSVYRFLEHLGCRWFAPGELGEVIPEVETVAIGPLDIIEKPSLSYRALMHHLPVTSEHVEWIDWMVKNRLNRLLAPLRVNPNDQPYEQNYEQTKRVLGGEIAKRGMLIEASHHSFTSYWLRKEDYFAEHPDWYALRDGKRVAHQLCLSNPEVIKVMIEKVLDFIKRNPEVDIIGLYADDGQQYCQCDNCRALGSLTDQYVHFVNQVARAVYEKYPQKRISLLAYGEVITPPTREHLFKNLVLSIAGGDAAIIKGWQEKGAKDIYKYEYTLGLGTYADMSFPHDWHRSTAATLREYKRMGLIGAVPQSELGNFYTYALNYYVFARFSWNTEQDIDEVLDDYFKRFYGAAAEAMKAYFTKWGVDTRFNLSQIADPDLELMPYERLLTHDRSLQRAEQLAKEDSEVSARIRKVRLSFEYTKLAWETMHHYSKMLKYKYDGQKEKARTALKQTVESARRLDAFAVKHCNERVFLAAPKPYQRYASSAIHTRALNPFLSERNQKRLLKFIESDNLALGKRATAQSEHPWEGNAMNATDGDPDTAWRSGYEKYWKEYGCREAKYACYPQWLKVDLGEICRINKCILKIPQQGYYHYKLDVSVDGADWITVAEKKDNKVASEQGFSHSYPDIEARFVRVTVTYNSEDTDVRVCELEVYG
ncbi:MAG TPA: DUF4838 domain-containing protein [Deltaproteobacteria bacterium]|nr:DUF4838 domain-containing protein [Deltaproteobacteria bacterium]